MPIRTVEVIEGERSQTLDGEGEFQMIEIYVSGIDRPLYCPLSQDVWDAIDPEAKEVVIDAVHTSMGQVLTLWSNVDEFGEEFVNKPLK